MAITWQQVITTGEDSTHKNSNVSVTDLGGDGSTTTKFFNEAGAFAVPSTGANTTYTNTIKTGTTKLELVGSDSSSDLIEFVAGGATTITRTNADTFTISSTDANTQLSNAGVIGKVLTGMSVSSGGAVAVTDTILVGVGKLENRTALNDAKATNVSTALSAGTTSTSVFNITTDGGTDDLAIPSASSSQAGMLSSSKLAGIALNSAKVTNVTTNLTISGTTGARTIVSSDGTDAEIPVATNSVSGVMSSADHTAFALIEASATADQTSAEIFTIMAGDAGGDFVIGSQGDDLCTIKGDLTVAGDLVVSGATVTLNVATIEVEDHIIKLANVADSSPPTTTTGNQSGIEVETSTDANNHPSIVWNKDGNLTGWEFKNHAEGKLSCNVMEYSDSTPSSSSDNSGTASGGKGSFWLEEDAKKLYIRIL